MRNDRERALDVLEAVEKVERYVRRGREAFERDELIRSWIIRHLEIIGEAARGFSAEMREKHPEIPWGRMIGMRNVIAHGYFEVDEDIVWRVAEDEMGPLKGWMEGLLKELQ